MINQIEYQERLVEVAIKFNNPNINWKEWHRQYQYYEAMWEEYFKQFSRCNINKQKCIQFVFWESCPGGMPFPHQNYAFDNNRYSNKIDGTLDSYLKTECNHFKVEWKSGKTNRKISEIIDDLCIKGVLIIDLYPTHGISLDVSNRKNLANRVFQIYSLNKLIEVGKKLEYLCKSDCIYVTSELYNAGINDKMDNCIKEKIKNALYLKNNPKFKLYQLTGE